ncbi:MAG: glycosyltransferase family 2 protein [Heteroscytonema crispum UTEX LB 1556]
MRQSFKKFEVLIVDDGSTDNTVDVIKPYLKRDSRFRLLQKPNGGLSSARNYGNHAPLLANTSAKTSSVIILMLCSAAV